MSISALCGVKILELARILAGPWAGQLLADLGADVVKVERAENGDDTRHWGPPFVEGVEGPMDSAYYHACNRGKRSVVANFEVAEEQAFVTYLAQQADVLIENFRTGSLQKYGLDYAALQKKNPRLIYCSITGFGQTGPYAGRGGYDFLIQGMGGMMDLTGHPDGPPTKSGIPLADLFAGLYAANAIQAALIRRSRTGEGAYIDCALFDSQIAVLSYQALNYMVSGDIPQRLGNGHPNIVPYDIFPVREGNIIIAAGNDRQFCALCHLLNVPELSTQLEFATNANRVRNRHILMGKLAALTQEWCKEDLLAQLEAYQVPAGPINTLAEVLRDPQTQARNLVVHLENQAAQAGSIPSLRSAILIDGVCAASLRCAPSLGEHTAEVQKDRHWGAYANQKT